jgi:hypothetical protein
MLYERKRVIFITIPLIFHLFGFYLCDDSKNEKDSTSF